MSRPPHTPAQAALMVNGLFHPDLHVHPDGARARVLRTLRDHALATARPPRARRGDRLRTWLRAWTARARTVRHLDAEVDVLTARLHRLGEPGPDADLAAVPRPRNDEGPTS